jgi:hypothetical protein
MLEILEQRDLPDGGARRALLVFQPDLLQRHQVVRQPRLALEHRGVRALETKEDSRSAMKPKKQQPENLEKKYLAILI